MSIVNRWVIFSLILAGVFLPFRGAVAQNQYQEFFVGVVDHYRVEYKSAKNEMAAGGLRAQRKEYLCKADLTIVEGWEGEIIELTSSGDGHGVLGVSVGNDIHFRTMTTAFTDMFHKTLITASSDLFNKISNMSVGDKVIISGKLFKGNSDCYEELSITQRGSMEDPEFIFLFQEVEPLR